MEFITNMVEIQRWWTDKWTTIYKKRAYTRNNNLSFLSKEKECIKHLTQQEQATGKKALAETGIVLPIVECIFALYRANQQMER